MSRSHTLRCDARQAEPRFAAFDELMGRIEHFVLGDVVPGPFIKSPQPNYIEAVQAEGVPVISTICVQDLGIRTELCRFVEQDFFEAADESRRPKQGDVLLTVDGGSSIGKAAVYELEGDFLVDSHVAIVRAEGLDSGYLAYLLASPLGQLQFQRAESGASGQTAVTEEDIRRFVFPAIPPQAADAAARSLASARRDVAELLAAIQARRSEGWSAFISAVLSGSDPDT